MSLDVHTVCLLQPITSERDRGVGRRTCPHSQCISDFLYRHLKLYVYDEGNKYWKMFRSVYLMQCKPYSTGQIGGVCMDDISEAGQKTGKLYAG
jgi:hypothetical protein